jgi:1-deoxy-D-xylulose-5-phosphate reductoisomerase
MKKIIILGSTGSIGTQALEIIEANPDMFQVVGLVGNSNQELLQAQAEKFNVPANRTVTGADAAVQLIEDTEADACNFTNRQDSCAS